MIARGVVLAALSLCVACGPPSGRTVILISIDTLRADALSSYGNPRLTSPSLDQLASDGVRFETALAPAPWTIPSHATLLTSLSPSVVGAGHDSPIPESITTVAELLSGHGYATAAVVNFVYLGRKFGFDQGFGVFIERRPTDPSEIVADGTKLLRQNLGSDQFLFLHFFTVHAPYDDPPPYDTLFADGLPSEPDEKIPFLRRLHYHDSQKLERFENLAQLRARYDAGLARVDAELGRLFEVLANLGLYDEALIVVTSDHGEAFFEHGVWVGHGLFVYEPELRVPLILKFPRSVGLHGLSDDRLVGLGDVVPTILDVMGHPRPPFVRGRSLLELLRNPEDTAPPSEDIATAPAIFGFSSHLNTHFIRTRRWKYSEPSSRLKADANPVLRRALEADPSLIISGLAKTHLRAEPELICVLRQRMILGPQLYDLDSDPGETQNLIDERPDVVQVLKRRIEQRSLRDDRDRADLVTSEAPITLDEQEAGRLRALGYVP